jgi:hypothetical protein
MADLASEWASDAAEILGEIPKAVSVRKPPSGTPVSFNALVTQPMVMQDLETGGFLNKTNFEIKFLRSDRVANPGVIEEGSLITYNGAEFRVVALADRPPSAWIAVKVQTKEQ